MRKTLKTLIAATLMLLIVIGGLQSLPNPAPFNAPLAIASEAVGSNADQVGSLSLDQITCTIDFLVITPEGEVILVRIKCTIEF